MRTRHCWLAPVIGGCRDIYFAQRFTSWSLLQLTNFRTKDNETCSCYWYGSPLSGGWILPPHWITSHGCLLVIHFKHKYVIWIFRSHVAGFFDIDFKEFIDRKVCDSGAMQPRMPYIAMKTAIQDGGLSWKWCFNPKTGIGHGSGGASSSKQVEAADITARKRPETSWSCMRYSVMGSTTSAFCNTFFKIKAFNYSSLLPGHKLRIVFGNAMSKFSW